MIKTVIIFLICFSFFSNIVFADQIFITYRDDGNKTIWDGKWSFEQEWKRTSEDIIKYDDGRKIAIKTGHDYENVYVMVNFISDRTIMKNADRAIVCFDTNNEKNKTPDQNDYCFLIALGRSNPITLTGGHYSAQSGHWKTIANHDKLIAIANMSDENDRYIHDPHATYEFRIPVEVIGSSNIYGFYINVFDANSQKFYSWPENSLSEDYPFIASPNQWGDLISPDKSIPEFELPLFVILTSMITITLISRLKISTMLR